VLPDPGHYHVDAAVAGCVLEIAASLCADICCRERRCENSREQIFGAIVVQVESSRAPASRSEGLAAKSARVRDVRKSDFPRFRNSGKVSRSLVVTNRSSRPSFVEVPGIGAHGTKRAPVVVVSHAGQHRHFPEPAPTLIVEQKIRYGFVGDKSIQPTVLIEIEKLTAIPLPTCTAMPDRAETSVNL
jgi:hypothetical protein